MNITALPVGVIRPSPHNPRIFRDKDPDLASLAESIAAVGVLQPVLVRPVCPPDVNTVDGIRFEIIAGERRWRASKLAQLETIPAIVREDLTEHQAIELTVTENLQREDLHPLEEANGVASLIAEGHDYRAVADRLGKSLGWVARRARLAKLSDTWRKLVASGKSQVSEWSGEMLELVARLEPKAQAQFFQEKQHAIANRLIDLRELRGWLADWTRELRLAPWAQDDATLDPQAGPCSTCPKRSSSNPGLFDDEETDGKRGAPGDRCLDATCWSRKIERHLARLAEDLRAKHGELRFAGWFPHGSKPQAFVGKAPLVNEWEGQVVKAGTPGAVPVLTVSGDSIGKLVWKKLGRAEGPGKGAAGKKGAKPKVASLAERREKLEARRRAWALEAICSAVETAATPALGILANLAAAFGTAVNCDHPGPLRMPKTGKSFDPLKVMISAETTTVERLWALVAPVIVGRWKRALSWNGQKGLAACQKEIAMVAEFIGLDLSPFAAQAAAAIPEPKAWAKLAAAEASAKKKPAKRSTKRDAKPEAA